MKKIVLLSFVAVLAFACNYNSKTEAEELKEREMRDSIQETIDQNFVDSLEKADMEKEQSDSGSEDQQH